MGLLNGGLFEKISEGINAIKAGQEEALAQKIRTTFHIADNEVVGSSHIRMSLATITDGAVITDRALYLHSKHIGPKDSNRIPYDEICEYIAVQSEKKSRVALYDKEGQLWEILEKSSVDAKTGTGLVQQIRILQTRLMNSTPVCKEQFIPVANQAIKEGQASIHGNGIAQETIDALMYLISFQEYKTSVAEILVEDVARKEAKAGYIAYINALQKTDENWDVSWLGSLWESFEKDYAKDLENLSVEMSPIEMEHRWNCISKTEDSGFSPETLALIAVRALNFEKADCLIKAIEAAGNLNQAQSIRFFLCLYKNKIMAEGFDAVRKGQVIDDRILSLSDGLGLTLLHYAMILRDDNAFQLLLKRRKWMAVNLYPDYIANALSYVNLAMLLGQDEWAMALLMETEPARKIRRSLLGNEVLTWGVKAGEFGFQILTAAAATAVSQQDFDSGYEDNWEDDYSDAPALSSADVDDIAATSEVFFGNLKGVLVGARAQLYEDLKFYIDNCMEAGAATSQQWRNSQDSFITNLVRLYLNSDALRETLEQPATAFNLLEFENYYFIAPPNVCVQEEEPFNIEKPFGTSWFSEKAHQSLDSLRAEYRALAKQYHPDVSKVKNCTVIIQEISSEYSDILVLLREQSGKR